MKRNQNQRALDSLLRKAMDSEVPPEVQARLRRHLAALKTKMESREAEVRPGFGRRSPDKKSRRLAWAAGIIGLFVITLSSFACFILAREVVALRQELQVAERNRAESQAAAQKLRNVIFAFSANAERGASEMLFAAAKAFEQAGLDREAVETLHRALELPLRERDSLRALLKIALLRYAKMGDPEGAITALMRCQREYPGSLMASQAESLAETLAESHLERTKVRPVFQPL